MSAPTRCGWSKSPRRETRAKDATAPAFRSQGRKLRVRTAPEQAILQEIRPSNADLVVPGVDRIQGDKLDFASVAQAVLSKSRASVLLICGQRSRTEGGLRSL